MSKVVPVVCYRQFYPNAELPSQPLDLIEGFDIEDVILTMVALRNSLERNHYDFSKDKMVASLLAKLPLAKSKRLGAMLFGKDHFVLVHSVVISKILVDLFRKLPFNQPSLDIGKDDYEERILDVILVYNEHQYNNLIVDGIITPDSYELVWGMMMQQRLSGFSEVDYARTGPIKHLILLRYLRIALGEKFQKLEMSLKENVGLDNIHQFLVIFINIYAFLSNKKNSHLILTEVSQEDPNYPYLSLMDLVIDKEVAASDNFDTGLLVTHPFFKAKNGNIYVLDHRDFSLLNEKGFIYFLYNKTNLKSLLSVKNVNELFSHFGLYFYEKFLLRNLFKALERPGFRVIISDDKLLSDFTLIVNETDVFVIEVKAVSMHYKVFDEKNFSDFKKHIDDYFRVGKGVPQLVRNISYMLNDSLNLLAFKKPPNKLNIFPIIIFVDPQISTHGIGDYVGEKARIEFAKFSNSFKEVKPLTMISIDFFIENIELLQRDRSLLKKLIQDYHNSINSKKQQYQKFRSTYNYVKSMMSFDLSVIGKEGVYRQGQKKIFKNLARIFNLRDEVEINN